MDNDVVEITGYMGKQPQFRRTKPKTYVLHPSQRPKDTHIFCHGPHRPTPDPEGDLPIEHDAIFEITRDGREYAAASVATYTGGKTVWHQIRAFNIGRDHPQSSYRDLFALRIARAGDQVRLTGRLASWQPPEGELFEYIEVDTFTLLRTKPVQRPD